ncbi:hypothetical protein C8Q76DRAFT_796788 [Earliella scabrosa]|nr:hypothetical protein C8Q76DRAFT_796788 [Earliella scabrosa]
MPQQRLLLVPQYTPAHCDMLEAIFRSCMACTLVCCGIGGYGHIYYIHIHRVGNAHATIFFDEPPHSGQIERFFLIVDRDNDNTMEVVPIPWTPDEIAREGLDGML